MSKPNKEIPGFRTLTAVTEMMMATSEGTRRSRKIGRASKTDAFPRSSVTCVRRDKCSVRQEEKGDEK